MGKLVSTSLLVAFMLISALANLGDARLGAGHAQDVTVATATLIDDDTTSTPSPAMPDMDDNAVAEKDDCPCKQDHSASKFVCGVTLALADGATTLHTPMPSKARFMLNKSASIPDFVDRLKRPPRTIL